jgi:hypothetical protein
LLLMLRLLLVRLWLLLLLHNGLLLPLHVAAALADEDLRGGIVGNLSGKKRMNGRAAAQLAVDSGPMLGGPQMRGLQRVLRHMVPPGKP